MTSSSEVPQKWAEHLATLPEKYGWEYSSKSGDWITMCLQFQSEFKDIPQFLPWAPKSDREWINNPQNALGGFVAMQLISLEFVGAIILERRPGDDNGLYGITGVTIPALSVPLFQKQVITLPLVSEQSLQDYSRCNKVWQKLGFFAKYESDGSVRLLLTSRHEKPRKVIEVRHCWKTKYVECLRNSLVPHSEMPWTDTSTPQSASECRMRLLYIKIQESALHGSVKIEGPKEGEAAFFGKIKSVTILGDNLDFVPNTSKQTRELYFGNVMLWNESGFLQMRASSPTVYLFHNAETPRIRKVELQRQRRALKRKIATNMVVEADLEAVDEKDDPTQYMLGEIDDDATQYMLGEIDDVLELGPSAVKKALAEPVKNVEVLAEPVKNVEVLAEPVKNVEVLV